MPNGGDHLTGLGQPGQREITRRDYASEIKAPDQHAIRLLAALLVALGTLGCVAIVLGPGLAYVAVFAAILYGAGRLIVGYSRRGQTAPAWVMLGTVAALVAWGVWGWQACEWLYPPLRIHWPVWAKAGVVMIAVFAFAPVLYLYSYRRGFEIVDPNHSSPRTAIERTKPVMPWSPETRDFLPEVKEPRERTVLRGLPVTQQGVTRYLSVPELEEGEPDVVVKSPAGQDIPFDHLRTFVEVAPVTGASFRTWSDREGWSHDYWSEVVSTLAELRILKPPEPRKATSFAVEPDEAARILEEFLGDGRA